MASPNNTIFSYYPKDTASPIYNVPMQKNKALKGALLVAQRALPGVEKNAENKYAKYNYVNIEQMLVECRTALLQAGLVFTVDNWTCSKQGDQDFITVMYTLSHPESGEEQVHGPYTSAVVVEKGKPLDKSQMSAASFQLTYVLRGLLMVARVDDLAQVQEVDARQDLAQGGPTPTAQFVADMATATSKSALDVVAKAARTQLGSGADRLASTYAENLQRISAGAK